MKPTIPKAHDESFCGRSFTIDRETHNNINCQRKAENFFLKSLKLGAQKIKSSKKLFALFLPSFSHLDLLKSISIYFT